MGFDNFTKIARSSFFWCAQMYLVLGMNCSLEKGKTLKQKLKVLSYSKSGDTSLIPLGLGTFALMLRFMISLDRSLLDRVLLDL